MQHCGDITVDTRWASDRVHVVTCDIRVQGPAAPTLTLQAGARVEFRRDVGLFIAEADRGRLVVDGASAPVVFTSNEAMKAPGDWTGLTIGYNDQRSTLTGLTLEYAGGNGRGGLYLAQASPTITRAVIRFHTNHGVYVDTGAAPTVTDSTLSDNLGDGLFVAPRGTLGGAFARDTVARNGRYPATLPASQAHQLDATSAFTGNAEDAVVVRGATLSRDATWRRLDVPYRFNHNVVAQSPTGAAVITVEAGARFRFDRGAGLTIADNAGLRVMGTAAAPVVFTSSSATPAAGDWLGLKLGNSCLSSQVDIAGLNLSYGGAQTYGPGTAGAIWWIDCGGSLRDSAITDSNTWGLFRVRATPAVSNVTYRNNALGNVN